MGVDCGTADEVFGVLEGVVEAAADGVEHADGLPDDFSADAITGQERNPEVGHRGQFLIVGWALTRSAFGGDSTAGRAVVAAASLPRSQPIPSIRQQAQDDAERVASSLR